MNLIKLIFTFNAITVTLMCIIVKIAEPYLPLAITNLIKYGRYAAKGKSSIVPEIEVPKRWFKHFYEFGAPLSSYVLFIALWTYLGIGSVPNHLQQILDILLGANRKVLVAPEHTILALFLITIQCWKRFYETHYVCIFSSGKISLGHYLLGYLHYIGTLVSVVGESQGFFKESEFTMNWDRLTYLHYCCSVIFLWASYKQLSCNIILANLRRNKKGEVITFEHKLPKGGLFDYISSPLQSTEILMYFMLMLILWNSSTYHYIFAWVLMNQIVTGLLGHWWYVETFEDYPKEKKALVPGIL
ncbi:polyprenol reductase [Athalia rosae]|uniref:polyprenol reductase n=1 Tax=Athalia rosae TaxID=37344 RepID=UPI0020333D54|nr:polyprenol reductase [Athalia rosae]XP_048511473.1 polyprenol reductase [Athalia rosae]